MTSSWFRIDVLCKKYRNYSFPPSSIPLQQQQFMAQEYNLSAIDKVYFVQYFLSSISCPIYFVWYRFSSVFCPGIFCMIYFVWEYFFRYMLSGLFCTVYFVRYILPSIHCLVYFVWVHFVWYICPAYFIRVYFVLVYFVLVYFVKSDEFGIYGKAWSYILLPTRKELFACGSVHRYQLSYYLRPMFHRDLCWDRFCSVSNSISNKTIDVLQRIQSGLAQVVCDIGVLKLHNSGLNSMALLKELHLLPIQSRSEFKVVNVLQVTSSCNTNQHCVKSATIYTISDASFFKPESTDSSGVKDKVNF